ncbi:MAG: hypothetical protein E6K69_02850 [Nitrospirae bacterium]|nr:MAG: hypothetical protein E6K69_02850 [Nitrospirota bacterium]
MISHTTAQFRRLFAELPTEVQRQARRAYRIFRQNPNHPSLRFKPVHPTRTIYSVRINPGYRAVGILESDEIVWYWIGSHGDYDHLLSQWQRRP